MPVTGTTMTLRTKLTDPVTGLLADAPAESLSLLIVDPNGKEEIYAQAVITHDGVGLYHKEILGSITGLWHWRWLVNNEAADEGVFEMESAFARIGKQETVGELEGEPTVVHVVALTQALRAGIKFTVKGDTNAPKIVFTVTTEAAIGATELSVSSSAKITIKIKAGELELAPVEQPDLTDLKVLLPRARRKCEGPWGPSNGRPPILDSELYAMVADACGEIVMLSGSFFHHQLIVKKRDPVAGFPTDWKTDTVLTEWESAIITSQVALNYYYLLFRNMKVSETIQTEATLWTYELSANVIRNYLESLRNERDRAIEGLRINNPVLDQFASIIRVRDVATTSLIEWWSGQAGAPAGLPGGQEASVMPWPGGFGEGGMHGGW